MPCHWLLRPMAGLIAGAADAGLFGWRTRCTWTGLIADQEGRGEQHQTDNAGIQPPAGALPGQGAVVQIQPLRINPEMHKVLPRTDLHDRAQYPCRRQKRHHGQRRDAVVRSPDPSPPADLLDQDEWLSGSRL